MSSEYSQIKTKICQNCGFEKPLSSFMQKAGLLGATYGNLCSACRGEADRFGNKKTDDSSTTSSTGKKIDGEAKIESDVQKHQQLKTETDEYYEERDKTSEFNTQQIKTSKEKLTTEQKIRAFLEKKAPPSEKKTAEKDSRTLESLAERESGLDSSEATMDTRVEKRKYQSEFYLQFLQKVKGSPHSKILETAIDRMEKNNKTLSKLKTTEEQVKELDDIIKSSVAPRTRK